MIRGTTALYRFKIPYPKSELSWATIKFWQSNNPSPLLPITKILSNCAVTTTDPKELCVSLTAEETARFSDKYKATLQFRAQHSNSGTIFGCKPTMVTVYPMSDDIIKDNPVFPSANEDEFIILDGDNIAEDDKEVNIDG